MAYKELPPVLKHVSHMAENGNRADIFQSPSGKKIVCDVTSYHIHLHDQAEEFYELKASISYGVVDFTLSTRRVNGDLLLTPHPDFYGGQFVGFALNYFTNHNQIPRIIRGSWRPEPLGQVYGEYMEALGITDDKVKAASQTWSGKTFARHGFYVFRAFDAQEVNGGVEAYFKREPPYDPNAPAHPSALNE